MDYGPDVRPSSICNAHALITCGIWSSDVSIALCWGGNWGGSPLVEKPLSHLLTCHLGTAKRTPLERHLWLRVSIKPPDSSPFRSSPPHQPSIHQGHGPWGLALQPKGSGSSSQVLEKTRQGSVRSRGQMEAWEPSARVAFATVSKCQGGLALPSWGRLLTS